MHSIFLQACRLAGLQACRLASLIALLLALAPSVWACTYFDAFKANDDGTVTDSRSGTVWQVCALGQNWTSSGCMGRLTLMTSWEAVQAARANSFTGKTDWRLPTKTEAVSIVGKFDSCRDKKRAVADVFQPVHPDGNLGQYWALISYIGQGYKAHYVNFNNGGLSPLWSLRDTSTGVRLVRAGRPSSLAEFNREFTKIEQYERDIAAQIQQDQAAANAANEARNNAQACGRLYAGKPVKLRYFHRDFFGRQEFYWAEGVIIGIGNGMASARVTVYDRKNEGDGYSVNSVHERACSDF